MAYEIPVTQARAELADLINRVVYGGERVVVTRHGKPLVALVSAADLERLDSLDGVDGVGEIGAPAEERPVASLAAAVHETAPPSLGRDRFGAAAQHRGTGPA
ncbi:type II toxin-antitoxin system Phd/YefM family antitoxin [Streptomyces sp. NPDC058417]|uniref:type II toxin-antitoxin system Phd/YefM family antitoxin n=1 Tax=unclassified Streptomyces TaxID=2593676 RepID=UPI00366721BC